MAVHISPCSCGNTADEYLDGPTACIASPGVMASIKSQISSGRVLSVADARLATLSGMLDIPTVGRTGFNDGVIYPPAAMVGPALAPSATRPPSARFSLRRSSRKQTLNCLVLLVDFSDNPGKQTPAHFQQLLFDPANADSMHSFYKEMSFGMLNVTGQVTNWIRARSPTTFTRMDKAAREALSRKTLPGSSPRCCRSTAGRTVLPLLT